VKKSKNASSIVNQGDKVKTKIDLIDYIVTWYRKNNGIWNVLGAT